MKGYKKYAIGSLVCFMAFGLMLSSASAFWGFGKSKKENNANYAGAVANVENENSKITTPTITVISPNGGEILKSGKTYKIKWKSRGLERSSFVNITLTAFREDGSQEKALIATYVFNKGVFNWKVLDNIPANVVFKIRIDSQGYIAEDESDGFFSIISKVEKPQITVISPNGGEVWRVGEIQAINWQAKNIPSDSRINLEIFKDGTDKEKATAIYHGLSANITSYKWTVSATAFKKYRILIKVVANNGIYLSSDTSDAPFSIVGSPR